ncbi:MAG: glycosyltransferase [Pelosinus sp.]|nr:glycosyltransferase [Pelosinus sp.]
MKTIIIGLPYFAKKIAASLSEYDNENIYLALDINCSKLNKIQYLLELFTADVIYLIGGTISKSKAVSLALFLGKRIIMHWVGTDVINARQNFLQNAVNKDYVEKVMHFCEVGWIQEELKQFGISAEIMQIAAFDKIVTQKERWPKNFSILSYVGKGSEEFYGIDKLIKLAKDFPDIEIKVAGIDKYYKTIPSNLKLLGWVNDMDMQYKNCVVYLRLPNHDGLAFSVLEALANGRYVCYSQIFSNTIHAPDYITLKKAINTLYVEFINGTLQQNEDGISFIQEQYNKSCVLEKICTQIQGKQNKKTILFLSALDFKEKSIQVISKTPQAYVQAGWDVNYIVARDITKKGNYFYEREFNPHGVNVDRFYMPFSGLIDRMRNYFMELVVRKIVGYISVFMLAYSGFKFLKHNKVDVIYGYEVHGILAVNILKIMNTIKNVKVISRFQGTFMNEYITNKQFIKLLLKCDHILALYLPSDLCIMTNDGTQGDRALTKLKSKNCYNYRFWVNGVDEQKLPYERIVKMKETLNISNNQCVFLTVCRLESWKRVDRGINAVAELIKEYNLTNVVYYIVGDGSERENLCNLIKSLNMDLQIKLIGAINNLEVKNYLNIADFFISTYNGSNVGNPLLEAIRAHKIIFTLNNGDTGEWIEHKKNGFIYNITDDLNKRMAQDMYEIIINKCLREKILFNIKQTEFEKLWTWQQRLSAEVCEVERLIR